MCEFCHQHGEGKKWYLQAKNYSDDLLSDVHRRKFVEDFVSHPEELASKVQGFDRLAKAPSFVRSVVSRMISRKMKKKHFGQVVPIEEIEEIFGFLNSIARMDCICRHTILGKEKRYCYGISLAPDGGMMAEIIHGVDKSFYTGPDTTGLEALTKEEAISAFHEHEKEGLCHTVWTFHAPFIGGICNCDRADCLAMRSTVTEGYSCHVPWRICSRGESRRVFRLPAMYARLSVRCDHPQCVRQEGGYRPTMVLRMWGLPLSMQ